MSDIFNQLALVAENGCAAGWNGVDAWRSIKQSIDNAADDHADQSLPILPPDIQEIAAKIIKIPPNEYQHGRPHFIGQLAWLRNEKQCLRKRLQAALNAGQAHIAGDTLPCLTQVETDRWVTEMSKPERWFTPELAKHDSNACNQLAPIIDSMH
jgi:hypothetical protein